MIGEAGMQVLFRETTKEKWLYSQQAADMHVSRPYRGDLRERWCFRSSTAQDLEITCSNSDQQYIG